MAAYEPIRDAFREFNRMIVDAEVFDKEHAIRRNDQEMKRLTILNGLEQQAFNNRMMEKEFALRVRGEKRMAENAGHARRMSLLNYGLNVEAGKRDQTRLEDTVANSQLNRQVTEHNLDLSIAANAPRPMNLAGLVSEENMLDSEFQSEFTDMMQRNGIAMDRSGNVTDLEGNLRELKPLEQRNLLIGISSLNDRYLDSDAEVRNDIASMELNVQELLKARDEIPAGPMHQAKRAPFTAELNKIRGMQQREMAKLTPAGQVKRWTEQADRLRRQARALASLEPKMAEAALTSADALDKRVKDIHDANLARLTKGSKDKEPTTKDGLEQIARTLNPARANLSGFPKANAAIEYANRMYNMLLQSDLPIFQQQPGELDDNYVIRLATEAIQQASNQHNKLYNAALGMPAERDLPKDGTTRMKNPETGNMVEVEVADIRKRWQSLRDEAEATLGYMPTTTFKEQMYFTMVVKDKRNK
jgi:hypothetical protein